ncbi:hypothetical protein E4T56_gene393 [Termitomyces sp. T112]|nr:hypothetical protein E4T56_gene393 [Termitomyces sp. T112]
MMPPSTSPSCKPLTAPYAAAMAHVLTPPVKPPYYVALFDGTVKQNSGWHALQIMPDTWDFSICPGQAFLEQANFPCLVDQSGLPNALSAALKLPSTIWEVSSSTKAFVVFANAIVKIDNDYQELQCKSTKRREAKGKLQRDAPADDDTER